MRRLGLAVGLLASVTVSGVAAASPPAPEPPGAAAPDIAHLVPETIVEVSRTRVIHFAVSPAPEGDLAPPASVADSAVLEIARAASVLGGHALGTVRVRGLQAGETTLTIGGSTIAVRVVEPRSEADDDAYAPRIVGPVSGAAAWGTISIGVEVRVRPGRPLRPITVYAGDWLALMPQEDTGAENQPYRQLRFTLDTRNVDPGVLELQAAASDASGHEQMGPAVRINVLRLAEDRITAGEAEWPYDLERPVRFGSGQVTIAQDDEASGGRYVDNASPFPAVAFPMTVGRAGWFQLMLVARGTRAQGALPIVSVILNETSTPLTNGRLLGEAWHRAAIGVPFRLDRGRHILVPLFGNDFSVPGLADRNLHLDRIEIGRVGYFDPTIAGSGTGAEAGDPGADPAEERTADDPWGLATVPLRVAFARPLHGITIPGTLELEGRVWGGGDANASVPEVSALINGVTLPSQRSLAPRFRIDPAHLQAGPNRVQLVARSDLGPVAATPVVEVHAPHDGAPRPGRRFFRFTVHDPRWLSGLREHLRDDPGAGERRAAAFFTRRAAALQVSEDLTGSFDVVLEARGDHTDAPPVVSVSLYNRSGMKEIGRGTAPAVWGTVDLGAVDLPAGRKRLVVRYENEHEDTDRDHPRFAMQALSLHERPPEADGVAPVATVASPASGQPMHGADAVVADCADDVALDRAELIVDGAPTGQRADLRLKPGRVVFPLLLRSLAPGAHTVTVRAVDAAGNMSVSTPVTIRVLDGPPNRPTRYERAVRLLDRFAYGPDPGALAAILTTDESEWFDHVLHTPFEEPGDLAALGAALAEYPTLDPQSVSGRVLAHLLATPNPARARFVLFVENHFSTWIRKTGGEIKWAEHVAFSRLGPATFDRLLFASAESPAMITYLDQARSYAGALNENYAREIMELHTLGVDGGYTQDDVTNLAHLLTGWTASLDGDGRSGGTAVRMQTFRFDPRLNDGDGTRVFGMAFGAAESGDRFDRAVAAIEHLAAHPSTARFIAAKLAGHYMAVPAPEDLVDELTARFLATNGDLDALLLAIAESPAFTESPARPERVAQPLDYVVRLFRATGHRDTRRAAEYLRISGQGLYDRPTPDGYPDEDSAYIDSNAILQRWKLALETTGPLVHLVPSAWRRPDGPSTDEGWGQRIVDVVAVRLTGRVLSEASNAAALEVLAAAEGSPAAQIRVIAPFIAQLPEANLR